jgi:hypothetical protein
MKLCFKNRVLTAYPLKVVIKDKNKKAPELISRAYFKSLL